MLARRPDCSVIDFRGNVDTRLGKIRDGVCDATLLALAGLKRLGKDISGFSILPVKDMLPAPAQGAVCIESRAEDIATNERIAALDHGETRIAVTAERALLAALDGSCRTPIAALATLKGETLFMTSALFSPDGTDQFHAADAGPKNDPAALGARLGRDLRQAAGPEFYARLMAVFD